MKKFFLAIFLPLFLFSCHFTSPDDQTQDYLKQYSDQKQPLEVDYTSPTGDVAVGVNKIVVHFTQPMVALSTVGQTTSSDLVTITPRVDGFFKWVNTRTLIFQAKGDLPYATDFKVTVSAGKQSLLGFAMLKDFEFSFNTPEPRVLSVTPQTASLDVKRSPEITLGFNQALSLAGLKSFLSFEYAADGNVIDFDVTCLSADPKKSDLCSTFHARVKEILPKSTSFKMTVRKGLPGLVGNRVLLTDLVYSYQTHGDFTVTSITCGNQYSPCVPGASLYIKSTNVIATSDFYKFMEVSPPLAEANPEPPYQSYYDKSLVLNVPLKPFQPYQVTLKAGLKDMFGQELIAPVSFYFHTLHEQAQFHLPYVREQVLMVDPDLDFGFAGTNLLMVTGRHRTQWTNVDLINFLNDADSFIWLDAAGDSFWSSPQTLAGKKVDEREFFSFPLSSVLGEKKTGIIVSQYSSPEVTLRGTQDHAPIPDRRWLLRQITNLAIHAKLAHNHGLIWVTRLDNGDNVPGVTVTFYNKAGLVLFQGTTDAKGLLKTPSNVDMVKKSVAHVAPDAEKYGLDKFFIFAEKDEDRSFMVSTWDEGLDTGYFYDDLINELVRDDAEGEYEDEVQTEPAKVKVDSGAIKNIRVHMLTDRGLYKPGETVNIKGYLREVIEPVLKPFQEAIDVIIANSQGDEVLRAAVTPNARGNFVQAFTIPEASPLGSYSVNVQSIDEARHFEEFYLSFDVEHFRMPEFKVEASHPDKNHFKGDPVSVSVSSNYLFGAPMKNGRATYNINKDLGYFSPTNDQGWEFGRLYEHRDVARESLQDRYLEDEGKLDQKGNLSVAVETKSDLPDVMSYRFETGVADLSGQSQWTSDAFIIHPADYYIGAKTDQFFFETGKPLGVSFAALAPKGDSLFDKSITVDLMRVTWVSLKSQTLAGEFETDTQRKEERVDGCVKVSAAKTNRCDFTVAESGYYFFKLSATDAKNRLVVTEVPFYVSGKGYSYWPSVDGSGIELILDKETAYVTGETAKVLIKSPFQKAHAMISIEREGILSFENRILEGSSPVIEVPIAKEYAPNIFVRVVLVKGALDYDPSQIQDPKNLTESLVKAGSVEIVVKPLNKDLKVTLKTDREIYKPGDTVNLALTVSGMTEPSGSEITVMAVDEGVLLAGGYSLKNPLDTFYASYTNQVAMSDTRTHYVRKQGSENKLADSSSGGGMMEGFRKKMIPLAYFNGALETDAEGHAHVSFTLPDQLTTFKIMAVANASIDQFGLGDSALKTQKEIMIRPALPRFIRLGDSFESGAVVHNNTDKKIDMVVTVEADNLDIESGETQKISVAARGTTFLTAKFATPLKDLKSKFDELVRSGKIGESIKANIRFVAKSAPYEDRVAITVPIHFEPAEETTATSGASAGTVSEFFEKSDSVDDSLGGLDIDLSSGVATRLADKIRRLRIYPYDCFEQRMSKIYPLILFPNTDAYFVGGDKDPTQRRQVIERLLQKLKYEQDYRGEFSYWPGSQGNPQLTLMAGEFLLLTQKAGYDVAGVLSRITDRIFAYLKQTDYDFNHYSESYKRELKVHALYILHLAGTPQSSYYEGLAALWDQMGARNKLRLVEMLYAENTQHPLVLKFLDDLKNRIRLKGEVAYVEGSPTDYDLAYSNKVATAVTLETLIKIKPDHPLLFPLLLGLLDQKTKNLYESSLDSLAIIKTIRAYTDVFPDAAQDVFARIHMNDKDLASFQLGISKPEDHLHLPLSKLPEKMQLKLIKDKGPVFFYDIKYQAFLKDYRSYGVEQGISLSREYTDLDGQTVTTVDLKQGEMYKVTLNLFFADESNYVALEEPIAAGLEPVNFNIKTERQSLQYDAGAQQAVSTSLKLDGYLSHREFRDDRVVLFLDHVPRGFYEFTYFIKVTNRGDYGVPPAKAQEMYNPEIFGTTGKQDVVVR